MELSKKQKKIARELIQLGHYRECKSFTDEIAQFTNSLEWATSDPQDICHKLYKKITSFDKHLLKRYGNMGSSHYFSIVYVLFYDGILTTEDISRFDVEVQDKLLELKKSFEC